VCSAMEMARMSCASAICQRLAFTMEKPMKTKLILAISTALLLSTAASAVQTDQSGGATVQTVKTVTTVQHIHDISRN
jgi:hypothetical protein